MSIPKPMTIERLDRARDVPLLIVCDHAGARVPAGVDLGVAPEVMDLHVAFDIGAADTARELARLLEAPALLNHVSRLVVDANRRPLSDSATPEISDGIPIPGNHGLDRAGRWKRAIDWHLPYHRAIARWIGAWTRRGVAPTLFSIHSFTPRLADGPPRPWPIGVLSQADDRLARPILETLRRRAPGPVAHNQPYTGWFHFGFTIAFHAMLRRLPHVMIELRQDQIDTEAKARAWAERIADAASRPLEDPANRRRFAAAPPGAPATWPELRANSP